MPSRFPALIVSGLATMAVGGCMTPGSSGPVTTATAPLVTSSGASAGSASLVAVGDRLELRVVASGLTAGQHGIHLHTVGSCTRPDFASAGSHLNPGGKQHGLMNPAGSHLGDFPNLSIGANGTGTFAAPLSGDPAAFLATIFDADGTAVVIHAAPDDQMTDPSGASGGRIACGVLTRR